MDIARSRAQIRADNLLQYVSRTVNAEVTKDVIKFSSCDNTYLLYIKEDITQLYSTVVEFSHYHHNSSTMKNKECERNNYRGTIGAMKEHKSNSYQ